MLKICHAGEGCSATLVVQSSVACFEVRGRVGREAISAMLIDVLSQARKMRPMAAVVDYRLAEVADTLGTLYEIMKKMRHLGLDPDLPLAIVVPSDRLLLTREHCRQMADCGAWRAAFTDPNEAIAWARRQAALLTYDQTHRPQTGEKPYESKSKAAA